MENKRFLSDDELKTLKEAKKILKKIDKKITSLEEIREKHFTDTKTSKWVKATKKLYDLLDEVYNKGGVTDVRTFLPVEDYLMIQYT